MDGLPWHPAVVHVPIGIGMVAPLVALGVAIAVRRGALPHRAWVIVVALQALAFAGGLVAERTGHNEEERVEEIVSEDLIHEHEERGELFVWLAGAALAAGVGSLALPEGTLAVVATAGAVVLSTIAAGVVMSAGHLGGELVYQHGAAGAYVASDPEPHPAERRKQHD